MRSLVPVLLTMSLGCVATGAPGIPTMRLGSAEAAVRDAERAGADDDPQASRHLSVARAEIVHARLQIREGEYDAAGSLLRRAEANAEVAATLSREANERADAEAGQTRRAKTQRTPKSADLER